ncbi:MAG: hypothetical protein HUJ26_02315 [Planctomycetaceae bacterium]|nr:hypothetical protein [Planctomycetaceae bacterium]
MSRRSVRIFLKLVMMTGIVLMPIGPCNRISNEGFGDAPGPIATSRYWQQVSYILIPTGAVIAIGAGICLVIVDRRKG